jgi:hypothetical protein
MRIDPKDYVRIGTAADIIGVTRWWVHRLIADGKLSAVDIDGQQFVLKSDAERCRKDRDSKRRKK